jgi:hypothetical protein
MTTFTIILPHLRNPGNDRALAICLDMLLANTINDFALIVDTRTDAPLHAIVNAMIEQAETEAVVYWSSDMFPAPGWDVPMLALFASDAFITPVLVEPGVIGIYPENVERDFGRTPQAFNRAAFEAWCVSEAKDLKLTGEGWFAPVLYPREGFLNMGGLPLGLPGDHHGFTSADMQLFEAWKSAGNRVVRARESYVYHLQRYSQIDEQEHSKRGVIN